MRQRLRPLRVRAMARRPETGRRVTLSPRARRIAGWVATIGLIGAVALFVRILGGNADGAAIVPTPTASPTAGASATILFGTRLDPVTQEVAADAQTARFVETDRFAWSYRPDEPPPETVWVEVRRGADGSGAVVQEQAPHLLAADARVIAFEVDAVALFDAFGDGPFQMRIYVAQDAEPDAAATFELVVTEPSDET